MAKQRGKGEGSIYQLKSTKKWRGSVELPRRADGARRRKPVYGNTKAEVQAKMNAVKLELGMLGDVDSRVMSTAEWFDYWLESIAAKRVSQQTLNLYRRQYESYIRDRIGRIPLSRVSVTHVREVITAIDHIPSTAEKVYSLMRQAFKRAALERKITVDPVALLDRPKVPEPDLEALTPDELAKVIAHVSQPGVELGALWLFYIFTGARRGEGVGLKWLDVHRDRVDVRWSIVVLKSGDSLPRHQVGDQVHGRLWRVRPKTKTSKRVIPLVSLMAAVMQLHFTHCSAPDGTPPSPSDFVFTRNGNPIDPDYVSKQWPKVLKAAGIDKHVRLHDVRHSTVDLLIDAGVFERTVQEIVGHSSRAMTRAYQSRSDLAELAAALEKAYGSLPQLESA